MDNNYLFVGLESFMICVTGTTNLQEQTIIVNFSRDLDQIKISTCAREIFMPFGICMSNEYETFRSIMDVAIMDDYRFNTV